MSGEPSVKILTSISPVLIFVSTLMGLLLFCTALPAGSQTADPPPEEPLHIESDRMIARKDQSMVEFIGNVKARRLNSLLLADSMKIFFMDEPAADENSQTRIKQIISTGNVEYTEGNRKGFADKAVYSTADETLILTGTSPRLVTGSSFITGKKITLFRNQDRVVVESDGSQRVEALFNPEDTPADESR